VSIEIEQVSLRECDVALIGGEIVDGSGAGRRRADVAVVGDRIAAVGQLSRCKAGVTLDVSGRVVAPGFIDVHSHDDRALLAQPDMEPKVSQGVTTVVAGNCGISLAPLVLRGRPPQPLDLLAPDSGFVFQTFSAYVEALTQNPPAVNAVLLIGHQTVRIRHVTDLTREATCGEIDLMRADILEAMESGAAGFSTGLGYTTSLASTSDEVVALASVAAAHGGIYATHIRDERDGVESALEEAFSIGKRAGLPVILSHHKVAGQKNFGRSYETLARIDRVRREHPIGLDAYPYIAGSSMMTVDDVEDVRIIVTWSAPHPEVAGRDLDDVAATWGCSRTEAVERLQPAGGVFFLMHEDDVRRILAYPHTMIGSDGLPNDGHPHPRLWGTFPRVLGHYSRNLKLFTLEEAVRRMSSLAAQQFGLIDRGMIRRNAFADLVVFDPATIMDRATFETPRQPSAGIDHVLVNGIPVWLNGQATRERPGRVVRRNAA
jgi:N-acyl-D-amino-acid deacylase